MIKLCTIVTMLGFLFFFSDRAMGQNLYTYPAGTDSRWINFENEHGNKGKGAMENKGAKGHSSEWIKAGSRKIIMDFEGSGIINRIWMTVIDRSPEALRSIHLEMFWDNSSKPAVSVPLGDFFGLGLGRTTPFQNALFSDPEGKSFNCYIPMPFKKHAKIVFVNDSKKDELLFYDVDISKVRKLPNNFLYFHAYWSNNANSGLGQDFEILPKVVGHGRFLGTNISVVADTIYRDTWFGEGEVKIYLDGDTNYPTLAGTGTEDYIGSAWSMGPFANLYQGCPIVNKGKGQYCFYRYHIADPIYFKSDCRVAIQQMGGAGRDQIREMIKAGARVKVVSVMTDTGLIKLLNDPSFPDIFDDKFPKDQWTNFYRIDNYSATAYFYLDKPGSDLPALPPIAERLKGIN